MSPKALKGKHLTTEFCQRVEERKRRCLAEEEIRAGKELVIKSYCVLLTPVTSFKYLGRVLLEADDNWPVVVKNLWTARQNWARLNRVLIREGADARTLGHIYIMLYGLETWVMKLRIGFFCLISPQGVPQAYGEATLEYIWDRVRIYPPL